MVSSKSTDFLLAFGFTELSCRKRTHIIRVIGQFVAKAMLDSRIIDLTFNKIFLKLALGESVPLTVDSLKVSLCLPPPLAVDANRIPACRSGVGGIIVQDSVFGYYEGSK